MLFPATTRPPTPSEEGEAPPPLLLSREALLDSFPPPPKVMIFGRQAYYSYFRVALNQPLQVNVSEIAYEMCYRYQGSHPNMFMPESVLNDKNMSEQQVIWFGGDSGAGFTAIESMLSPTDFFTQIMTLSDGLKNPIIDALKDAGMVMPDIPEQRIKDAVYEKSKRHSLVFVLEYEFALCRPVNACREDV